MNVLKLLKIDLMLIKDWIKSDWECFFKVVLVFVIGGVVLFVSGGIVILVLVVVMYGFGFGVEVFLVFGGL